MPVIKLRVSTAWLKAFESAAQQSGQGVPGFLLGLIAHSCPPPRQRATGLDDEVLVKKAEQLCLVLDHTRGELQRALSRLVPAPRTNPAVALKRRRSSVLFRRAMQKLGLTHAAVAEHLGLSRTTVSKVVNGSKSLPPAWSPMLAELLGEDWMSE
jgi:hypothetical protein